jgi:deoxyribodipyrimidine photolyase
MFEDLRAQATGNSPNKQGTHGSNDVNWLVFELLWRDFFRFVTKKYNTAQTPAAAPAMA